MTAAVAMKITPRKARWLGRFGAWFIRLLGVTWRTRRTGVALPLPEDPRFIFAFLHGDMMLPAFLYRKIPALILITGPGDG